MKKTLDYDKTVYSVWEQIMYIQGELGNMQALAKVSEEAMDMFPNQSKVYYFNGIANNEIENHKTALQSYQQALMMSGKKPKLKLDLYRRIGETYFHLNKADKAEENFEKAIAMNPDDINILNTYAYSLAEFGDVKKAKKIIEKSKSIKAEHGPTQSVYGWVYYKMKDYKEAKKWIGKALQNGGDDAPKTLENYGDVLYPIRRY